MSWLLRGGTVRLVADNGVLFRLRPLLAGSTRISSSKENVAIRHIMSVSMAR